jgi:enoyl-CoA hydratase/carnithine racemase
MKPAFVTVERHGSVAVIRIDRPPLNILNLQTQDELLRAAEEIQADPSVRSALIYGGEKNFAAGADIREMAEIDPAELASRTDGLQRGFTALAGLSKPVAAAITGFALGGGCELALCADVRFAADDAVLGQPEILLGIMPGSGGTQRLPRVVGPAKAKGLMLTGRKLSADEAFQLGLVDIVVPAADLFNAALQWANQFENAPAVALAAIKRAIDDGMDTSLDEGLALERALFASVFATEDKKIGIANFVSKSKDAPKFVSR